MSTSKQHDRAFFYVAGLRGETHDPMSFLRASGVSDLGAYAELFATALGDVYIPVNCDGEDAGFVFVAPTMSSSPWRVFFTVQPLKQGEMYGDDGPLTDYDEALAVAEHWSKGGGAFAVFSFTPRNAMQPITMN